MTPEIEEKTENLMNTYSSQAQKFESVVDYDTKLKNFEGPLDLLLFLVNRAEIEIKDIFVSEVTEQFIAYVNSMENVDIEKESEYLSMAATLLEIKSKAMLPVVTFDDDEEEIDPEKLLFQQLEEYKLFKEASVKLKEQETTDIYFKEPDKSVGKVKIAYSDFFNVDKLIQAFSDLLAKTDLERRIKGEQKEIPKDVFTVAEKISFIKSTLLDRERCSFFDLFTEYATKSEIITTFQALLELLKLQYLTVDQDATFGDIVLTIREDRSEDIGDLSEYN